MEGTRKAVPGGLEGAVYEASPSSVAVALGHGPVLSDPTRQRTCISCRPITQCHELQPCLLHTPSAMKCCPWRGLMYYHWFSCANQRRL